ncbi:DUF1127 domain-containing protein [Kiloniella sp. b19]
MLYAIIKKISGLYNAIMTEKELRSLSDGALYDLGIERGDIHKIAFSSF